MTDAAPDFLRDMRHASFYLIRRSSMRRDRDARGRISRRLMEVNSNDSVRRGYRHAQDRLEKEIPMSSMVVLR